MYFRYVDDVMLSYGLSGDVSLPQQYHCSVLHGQRLCIVVGTYWLRLRVTDDGGRQD